MNPQQLVLTLMHVVRVIRQSLAILEYLDEAWPSPRLLPMTARDRARVRSLAQLVACDIHPLNNLRVLRYFEHTWRVPQSERDDWVKHWIAEGFAAMEALLEGDPATGAYCHGQTPGLADCCLIPQVFNARRFGVDMAAFPTIARIEKTCLELPAFTEARPDKQPDAQLTA
jgi:maleylacetoacetate isomerase